MRLKWVIAAFLISLLPVGTVFAQEPAPERGLLITPPRQYLNVEPGREIESSFTVANLTESTIDVTLSVEQFSVADYTYDYIFEEPKEDWVNLEKTQVSLKKSESSSVMYTVSAPQDAKPGGHYFTLFASVKLGEGRQIRAATVLYVTAGGELTKRSTITQNALPWVTFGGDIPLRFNVQNTGNTHFLVYISGVLRGMGPTQSSGEAAHLLLPGKTRVVEGLLPGPFIPGIYEAVYGYRDEDGKDVRRSQYIIYTPPWFWVLVTGTIWMIIVLYKHHKRSIHASIDS